MARSLDDALDMLRVGERASAGLWKFRLAFGWTILFAALVGLFAFSWDIQWHTAVGRDRTLTAPHLFILGSATLMGLASLAMVLIETRWAQRSTPVAQSGTTFAGFFSGSLGAYLVGYGALDTAIAFPIDQYWHTLYGVDVTIWAPFHVMLLTGFCMCCLGVAYMLVEGARLAVQQEARWAALVGYLSAVVAFATLMAMFSFFLPGALTTGYISLGWLTFTVYPLMLGAMGTFVLIAAIHALPWRAVATCVAIVYAFFGLISYLLIPLLMTWLLDVEQQSLLPGAPTASVLVTNWQFPLIIAAVLLDLVTWLARRRGWPWKGTSRITLIAASIGMSLAALFYPFFTNSQFLATASGTGGAIAVHPGHPGQGAASFHTPVLVIVVVSLLLGVLGIFVGNWLGAGTGELMQRKEQ